MSNNIYYVVQYDHKYGSDVIGLFATQEEAELYARKDIIEHYFNDFAQEEDEPMPPASSMEQYIRTIHERTTL